MSRTLDENSTLQKLSVSDSHQEHRVLEALVWNRAFDFEKVLASKKQ